MGQKTALGKGLASLFPGIPSSVPGQTTPVDAIPTSSTGAVAAGAAIPAHPHEQVNKDRIPGIAMVAIEEIHVNPYQPRRDFDESALDELAASIRANGIIQPLVVRKTPSGQYELIAGERRLRASKMAELKHVPIVVRRSTDREALELALVENIQRQNLNCVDEALAYFQLMEDFSLTQEEVAGRVGKDRATVANYLRLLRLPQEILADLKSATLSFGHGKALVSIEEPELRMKARNEIVEKHLSVREAEALVERTKQAALVSKEDQNPSKEPRDAARDPVRVRLSSLGLELSRQFGARVELKGSERRGKIIIHYANRQELDRVLESLQSAGQNQF